MKKLNTKGFSHVEMFIAIVVVVVVGGIGFYTYNSIKNRSSQAETVEKATPEQLAFTPAEKAAADAEPEAGVNQIFNQNGIYVAACRVYVSTGPSYNRWQVRMTHRKTVDADRNVIVINLNQDKVIYRNNLLRTAETFQPAYGSTKSGYIKFLIGQTGANRTLKFSSLQVC